MDKESFGTSGHATERQVFTEPEIQAILGHLPDLGDASGSRSLLTIDYFKNLARDPRLLNLVSQCTGATGWPVRGILFDKTPFKNWALGWHQDNKIAVTERHQVEGYGSWSIKEGVTHCRPPLTVLEGMIALRIALDPNDETNGPLLVISGSNRYGQLDRARAANLAKEQPVVCLANPGDIVLMSPLTLHCSGKATEPKHRRVIQFEYATVDLHPPLQWAFTS